MKEFITYLLEQLVNKPEQIVVNESKENGFSKYIIEVADEDMGFVIGKGGRTIRSIRSLVKSKAIKEGIGVRVELKDNDLNEEND